MTPLRAQRAPDQGEQSEEDLMALIQKGQDDARRLSSHVCLLERRLRLGADPADLLLIVHAIKFTSEDLQALFQSVVQVRAFVPTAATGTVDATERPLCAESVDLKALFTRCIASAQQQARHRGASLLCAIAPDLPSLTTDPKMLAQIFSLLLEHAARVGGNDGLEIRVCWTDGVLVIDVYDAGRGIAKETYATLQKLVGRLQGTVVVSRELGMRSRVELSLPSMPAQGGGTTAAHRGRTVDTNGAP